MIPDEAVEAAAVAMEDAALSLIGSDLGTMYRNDIARAALAAAAPHLAAKALQEAADDTRARGDIGKDGGIEAWTYLEWRARKEGPK